MMSQHLPRDIHFEIARLMDRWQDIVNTIASVANIPYVLINRFDRDEICVQVANDGVFQLFLSGNRIPIRLNSYCSKVIESRKPLLVENATGTAFEIDNPTYTDMTTYYFGVPLLWPNKKIFGTLCMLGRSEVAQPEQHRRLLSLFQKSIEYDLELLSRCQTLHMKRFHDEQRFLEVFNTSCERYRNAGYQTSRPLQSELFTMMISQFLHWNQLLDAEFDRLGNIGESAIKVKRLAAVWSSLLIMARETELIDLQICVDPKGPVCDVTPIIEGSAFKSSITLGIEIDLLSYLPNPLLVRGQKEIWSILGLAIVSILLICARGLNATVLISVKQISGASAIEWTLLNKGELIPLSFYTENQSLFSFLLVFADLAGVRLQPLPEDHLTGQDTQLHGIRIYLDTIAELQSQGGDWSMKFDAR